jgi:hypothetical protein
LTRLNRVRQLCRDDALVRHRLRGVRGENIACSIASGGQIDGVEAVSGASAESLASLNLTVVPEF